ncbi:Protein of unknown function (DUF2637) [Micromonospora viridifaciens]|uniref:DUF2637 domain-containing protein n=1 Tax=Micromonospora viridifaciens TaxID=1881 RepID=A0A1C4ZNG1_MICVI|nr:DUF2637 domain-containing protein [Micromonospora viridifaciens]SCF34346.1 Protein of unknown function (DUF2637) [Micromonospora viridifaciens]
MATPEQRPADLPAVTPTRHQRLENRIQVLIMLLIGGAAGAASFRHVHDVAAAHGQPGWIAWVDAAVLELASIATGVELRRNRRLAKSVAFPATALTVAVFLSLGAQVVEAEASAIGWIAAALPALGFLTMVKIALGRADPAPPVRSDRSVRDEPGPAPVVDATVPDASAAVPGPRLPVPATTAAVRDTTAAVRDTTTAVPDPADRDPAVPDRRGGSVAVRDRSPEITALVPAARTAARTLTAQGTPLSRKALAQQLRADGHQLSNATASALVRLLRAESTPPSPAPDGSVREEAP